MSQFKDFLPKGYTLFNYILLILLILELFILAFASLLGMPYSNADSYKGIALLVAITGFILLLTDPRANSK